MSLTKEHKITGILEQRFKRFKSDVLDSSERSQTEKRIIQKIANSMNVFHQVEGGYTPTIDGWRSYPRLEPDDVPVLQKLVEEFGGKYEGVFKD